MTARATTCTHHCAACDRHFHSCAAFDAHRAGDYSAARYCRPPEDHPKRRLEILTNDGVCRLGGGEWRHVTIWATSGVDEARARLSAIGTGGTS